MFNDLFKLGKDANKSDGESLLDAINFIRKNGIYDPVYNPNPVITRTERPHDPNNITGPSGAGADPFPATIAPGQFRFDGFVSNQAIYDYKIEFENKPTAGVPAQIVHVTQTLDADLDFSTFAFKGFGFGNFLVSVPDGAIGSSFSSIADATASVGVLVKIDAAFDTQTGLLDITYTSLDPATNDVPFDPTAGFLPPEDGSGRGDGFLTYSVKPKAGLANATDFTAIASIVFDTEVTDRRIRRRRAAWLDFFRRRTVFRLNSTVCRSLSVGMPTSHVNTFTNSG